MDNAKQYMENGNNSNMGATSNLSAPFGVKMTYLSKTEVDFGPTKGLQSELKVFEKTSDRKNC